MRKSALLLVSIFSAIVGIPVMIYLQKTTLLYALCFIVFLNTMLYFQMRKQEKKEAQEYQDKLEEKNTLKEKIEATKGS